MRYFILLYLGLCSCISNVSKYDLNDIQKEGYHDSTETVHNELGVADRGQTALSDSLKIAVEQELLSRDTIELMRLKDLLTIQNIINSQKHIYDESLDDSPIDSCEILLFSGFDSPCFKIAITKELSLVGIDEGNELFSFDRMYPVFPMKYEISANLFKCIDNVYLQKTTPKILKKEVDRIVSSESTIINIEYFYKKKAGKDRYVQSDDHFILLPQYTYGVDAQYLITVVNQMYFEYCRNIGLPTNNILRPMKWYLK